ncbi:MAG: TetR/AcrR family transcriptional regulator [Bacteroidetes bacterium]|nr:TetR family transcriptional regulator [Rhodothermaceae bacterium RA]RMH68755.1 MAG: TetR/AcrR family transcriptional regulator [Bacteroidota bacterium]
MERSRTSEADLRRAILDTARRLLVREGYKGLTMRRIARAIGYSATAIYLHFDNKDALFHALIEEGMERLYAAFREAAARHPDDPVQRLQALCRAYVAFGLDQAEYYEIMFMAHPEHMERYPAEKYRRARRNLDLLAETLADGHARGMLDAPEPRVGASIVWSSLHGAVSLLLAHRVDVRIAPEVFIHAAIAHTIHGFLPVREAPVVSPILPLADGARKRFFEGDGEAA